MGKALETKKRILDLLKKKNMTTTELSRELGLSAATVSQHLDELGEMGAVEKVNNEFFKKLKYYRATDNVSPGMNNMGMMAKYAVTAIVAIVAISGIYLYYLGQHSRQSFPAAPEVSAGNATGNATNVPGNSGPAAIASPGAGFACPLLSYRLNGTVSGYAGFSLYKLNASQGVVNDYVMGNDSNGTLRISEFVSQVLNQNNPLLTMNRSHYAVLTQVGSGFNTTAPGISVTLSPARYDAINNTTINLTVVLNTANAKYGTYWLRIDGPCGGGVPPALVTVGRGPYSGAVTADVVPYG